MWRSGPWVPASRRTVTATPICRAMTKLPKRSRRLHGGRRWGKARFRSRLARRHFGPGVLSTRRSSAFGPVDILVNAAGVSAQGLIADGDDATWYGVIDVNLNGPYRTTKRRVAGHDRTGMGAHRQYCLDGGQCRVSLATVRIARPKSGLLGLTRCVALEGAPHGVTCNAINPGSVGTGYDAQGIGTPRSNWGKGTSVEENFALIAEDMPQKRLITVEEIAAHGAFPVPRRGARSDHGRYRRFRWRLVVSV